MSSTTVYENIKTAGEANGNLKLSNGFVVYQSDESGKHMKLGWTKIGKYQITPAKHSKNLLKIISKDGKAKTFEFPDRETLVKAQKDIKIRMQKLVQKDSDTTNSGIDKQALVEPKNSQISQKATQTLLKSSGNNAQSKSASSSGAKARAKSAAPATKSGVTSVQDGKASLPEPAVPTATRQSAVVVPDIRSDPKQNRTCNVSPKARDRSSVAATKPGATSVSSQSAVTSAKKHNQKQMSNASTKGTARRAVAVTTPALMAVSNVNNSSEPTVSSTKRTSTATSSKRPVQSRTTDISSNGRARNPVAATEPGVMAVSNFPNSSEPTVPTTTRQSAAAAAAATGSNHTQNSDIAAKTRARSPATATKTGASSANLNHFTEPNISVATRNSAARSGKSSQIAKTDVLAKSRARQATSASRPGAASVTMAETNSPQTPNRERHIPTAFDTREGPISKPNGKRSGKSNAKLMSNVSKAEPKDIVNVPFKAKQIISSGSSPKKVQATPKQKESNAQEKFSDDKQRRNRQIIAPGKVDCSNEIIRSKELIEEKEARSKNDNRRFNTTNPAHQSRNGTSQYPSMGVLAQAARSPAKSEVIPPPEEETTNRNSSAAPTASSSSVNDSVGEGFLVEAKLVEDHSEREMSPEDKVRFEEETRKRVMKEMMVEAAEAVVIENEDPKALRKRVRMTRCIFVFLVLFIIAVMLGSVLGTASSRNSSSSQQNVVTSAPTVSAAPSASPSEQPTATPKPSTFPTRAPSSSPSRYPTKPPTASPSNFPSSAPSSLPTRAPDNNFCDEAFAIDAGESYYVENIYAQQSGYDDDISFDDDIHGGVFRQDFVDCDAGMFYSMPGRWFQFNGGGQVTASTCGQGTTLGLPLLEGV